MSTTSSSPAEQRGGSSAWAAPPFLLTACLTLVTFGVSWGAWTNQLEALRTARAEDRASVNSCMQDLSAVKLRLNTLETDKSGQERLWLEKWSTIDSRSQRIERMLEELLRGRMRSASR